MKKAGETLKKTQLVEKAASRAKRKPDPEKEFSLNALTVATQEDHHYSRHGQISNCTTSATRLTISASSHDC